MLRKAGIHCTTLADVYGKKECQSVEDTTWMKWAAENGYAVFTANPRILKVSYEREALQTYGTQVFCVANADTTRQDRAFLIGRHILSMTRKISTGESCFWRLNMGSPIRYDI